MSQNYEATESVEVRRGKMDSITVYDVTEDELEELERPTESVFLNFAIFLFTTAISFFVALITTSIQSTRVFCVFVIIFSIGIIGGGILTVLWCRSRSITSRTIKKIKNRATKENNIDQDEQYEEAVDKE